MDASDPVREDCNDHVPHKHHRAERRAEGVSVRAYLLWAVASGLILVHARSMRSVVFTVLMISQIVGCVLIATMATIYGVP